MKIRFNSLDYFTKQTKTSDKINEATISNEEQQTAQGSDPWESENNKRVKPTIMLAYCLEGLPVCRVNRRTPGRAQRSLGVEGSRKVKKAEFGREESYTRRDLQQSAVPLRGFHEYWLVKICRNCPEPEKGPCRSITGNNPCLSFRVKNSLCSPQQDQDNLSYRNKEEYSEGIALPMGQTWPRVKAALILPPKQTCERIELFPSSNLTIYHSEVQYLQEYKST